MTTRVAYVTTCRSDYGPSYWLLHDLFADARFDVRLVVGGAHLSPRHGHSVDEIERDGWPIAARVPFLDDEADAAAAARALAGFGAAFATLVPDLVLLYGDRFELLPAATAALLARVPIAHLCGGDITEGAIDDAVRHAVTKLAHLHFPSSARSAARLLQLGEEDWRVHALGDPALDHLRRSSRAGAAELAAALGFVPDRRTLLVTLHPTTLAPAATLAETAALMAALLRHDGHVVVTAPAPDPGAADIRAAIAELVRARPRTVFVESLGSHRFRGLLPLVGAMVGNSSSGLIDAPCVGLPVVNIGARQAGRDRAANVVDVAADADAISAAIAAALAPGERRPLASPYGDGNSAPAIVAALAALPERARLLYKRFVAR